MTRLSVHWKPPGSTIRYNMPASEVAEGWPKEGSWPFSFCQEAKRKDKLDVLFQEQTPEQIVVTHCITDARAAETQALQMVLDGQIEAAKQLSGQAKR
jgi:hypothetical protein